jgi:predicted nucleic acid-binding protein
VIYIDTSVFLAYLWAEDRRPPGALWQQTLIASRLLVYEAWTRIHARQANASHGHAAQEMLTRINIVELSPDVLARALESWPSPVRTLDALHLASIIFLLKRNQQIKLATYDERMKRAAGLLGIELYDLET